MKSLERATGLKDIVKNSSSWTLQIWSYMRAVALIDMDGRIMVSESADLIR